ncbi:MAG: hypothetical protein A2504_11520 [Bdellovibrionales bacterium RIFOXYD12_FULL_39_22]|nr:MAG: hypothetical protein A2385_16035 [Bdellovibrionales bacterium RIFOXYB1_FULL_39_21]OFZ44533.1 MAG: hypothetical protein A2485_06860 [Bdellovibrionales bacterium RIFOXYC12_FULL_39_17]OFZ49825.1 MAG: hypothetical protein A2404_00605 [Bdellovibrionales bacterium RIFOXYC1_FULL_39_130]OFZ76830.1 MAG: hypothetical protein A2560_05405 [Bdellovibrionales bacterium RIFOXYD1_FULL_39_84]OFZ95757.1 MAG: hypothetical protein A2504_11520 [Bdellovibrionales bacterium RIFOXYD12_FULL_39_22]HLE10775.1 AA
MLSKFYNFSTDPFSETPNTYFYFSSNTHQNTLAQLTELLEQGRGFISITGEVGTGKSMLARYIIKQFKSDVNTAFLYWPNLEGKELIAAINRELNIPSSDDEFNMLERFLLANAAENRQTILFIDEAQSLSLKSLETIRQISNLECETKKLIQIILLGQPELTTILARPDMRQVNQRISKNLTLSPLPFHEVEMYIKHRIELARGSNFVRFDYKATKMIYNYSRGIPRLINLICKTALLCGVKEQTRIITDKIVKIALKDTNLAPIPKSRFFIGLR